MVLRGSNWLAYSLSTELPKFAALVGIEVERVAARARGALEDVVVVDFVSGLAASFMREVPIIGEDAHLSDIVDNRLVCQLICSEGWLCSYLRYMRTQVQTAVNERTKPTPDEIVDVCSEVCQDFGSEYICDDAICSMDKCQDKGSLPRGLRARSSRTKSKQTEERTSRNCNLTRVQMCGCKQYT